MLIEDPRRHELVTYQDDAPLRLHLLERLHGGVWIAVQQLSFGVVRSERRGYWLEPDTTFIDGLGQHCWFTPRGSIFCSDTNDLRHHGVVESEEVLHRLGFTQFGGELINNEDGATDEAAPSKTSADL